MLNWRPENADMYEDVQTRYTYAHSNLNKPEQVRLEKMWRSSRDSARTPVQWDDTENAGFTTGTPWFYVNQNYRDINVAQQEADPDSILNFYRKAIKLRKSLKCVRHGVYKEHFKRSSKVYTYSMSTADEKILVVCSFTEKAATCRFPAGFDGDKATLILQNYPDASDLTLRPYECRVYLFK